MAEAAAATPSPAANVKPTKPDQAAFDKAHAQAEKEYKDALNKYVSASVLHLIGWCMCCTFLPPASSLLPTRSLPSLPLTSTLCHPECH